MAWLHVYNPAIYDVGDVDGVDGVDGVEPQVSSMIPP